MVTSAGNTVRAVVKRRRPRALTLVVLFVVTALIVLANLSSESIFDYPSGIGAKSFGWPLIWHRYVFLYLGRTVGWYFSTPRLAGNLAIWLVLLAASGGACEWLLRHYNPRPRWSLRSMLVGVAMAAVFCAWFAAARNRANLQDPLIAAMGGSVRVERWGPKWLDMIGADRFRRHIISAEVFGSPEEGGNQKLETILPALERLPRLRYLELFIERIHLDPGIPGALAKMRQLRSLSIVLNAAINNDDDRRIWHECLVAIGQMPQLEYLCLYNLTISSESLAHLAGLANLKWLYLRKLTNIHEQNVEAPVLAHLPPLPRLECIGLGESRIHDRDLPHITAAPRLRSLDLKWTSITDAGLRELARLPLLNDLVITGEAVSPMALESLASLKRLRALHIYPTVEPYSETVALDNDNIAYVRQSELDRFHRGLRALRQSRPGIVIDGDTNAIDNGSRLGPEAINNPSYGISFDHPPLSLPKSDLPSMTPTEKASFEAAGGWARFDAARWNDKTLCF